MNVARPGLMIHPGLDAAIGENNQGPSVIRVPGESGIVLAACPDSCT